MSEPFICPWCGNRIAALKSNVFIPTHDDRPPFRSVCPASMLTIKQAEGRCMVAKRKIEKGTV